MRALNQLEEVAFAKRALLADSEEQARAPCNAQSGGRGRGRVRERAAHTPRSQRSRRGRRRAKALKRGTRSAMQRRAARTRLGAVCPAAVQRERSTMLLIHAAARAARRGHLEDERRGGVRASLRARAPLLLRRSFRELPRSKDIADAERRTRDLDSVLALGRQHLKSTHIYEGEQVKL